MNVEWLYRCSNESHYNCPSWYKQLPDVSTYIQRKKGKENAYCNSCLFIWVSYDRFLSYEIEFMIEKTTSQKLFHRVCASVHNAYLSITFELIDFPSNLLNISSLFCLIRALWVVLWWMHNKSVARDEGLACLSEG